MTKSIDPYCDEANHRKLWILNSNKLKSKSLSKEERIEGIGIKENLRSLSERKGGQLPGLDVLAVGGNPGAGYPSVYELQPQDVGTRYLGDFDQKQQKSEWSQLGKRMVRCRRPCCHLVWYGSNGVEWRESPPLRTGLPQAPRVLCLWFWSINVGPLPGGSGPASQGGTFQHRDIG